jgi:hypothetical protein
LVAIQFDRGPLPSDLLGDVTSRVRAGPVEWDLDGPAYFADATLVTQGGETARERTIIVAAALNLVIGTVLLAWAVIVSVAVLLFTTWLGMGFGKHEEAADLQTSTMQLLAVAAAIPLAQIIAGIALLVNARWGRWLTLTWAFGWAGVVVAPYAGGVVMVLFAPWWRPALARVTRTR